jgi:hypothetical protein
MADAAELTGVGVCYRARFTVWLGPTTSREHRDLVLLTKSSGGGRRVVKLHEVPVVLLDSVAGLGW